MVDKEVIVVSGTLLVMTVWFGDQLEAPALWEELGQEEKGS